MRIHALGIGSIGTLIAHNLRRTNPALPISLIVKSAKKFPSVRSHDGPGPYTQLSVVSDGKTSYSGGYELEKWRTEELAPPIVRGHEEAKNGPIQSLVVCLKTWSTVPALARLAPRLSPSSVIVLLQNGMGVYDELCADVFPNPDQRPFFVLGTTTHGVSPGPRMGSVKHNSKPGEGRLAFGVVPDPRKEVDMENWLWGYPAASEPILAPPTFPPLPIPPPPPSSTDLSNLHGTLSALLSMGYLHPTILPMPHLHHQLMLKLALNSIINPLTATLGLGTLPNKCLLTGDTSFRLVKSLSEETSKIITAYLQELSSSTYTPPDVVRIFSPESLQRRVRELCKATADNISSMALDVGNGRITEIDHINGYIVSLGKRLGIDAPRHRMLVEMVKWQTQAHSIRKPQGGNVAVPSYLKLFGGEKAMLKKEEKDLARQAMELEAKRLDIEERKVKVEEAKLARKKTKEEKARKIMGEDFILDRRTRRAAREAEASVEEGQAAAAGSSN